MRIHVVQAGDTLWRIALQYGSSLSQVALANQLADPNSLVVGQALVIPEPGREYVVQPGDRLWTIAARHHTTVQALADANRLTNASLLFPGQMLIIPYAVHQVRPGETLWSIASRYGVPVETIAQTNGLADPSLLFPGQMLRIPSGFRPPIEVNAYTISLGEPGRQEVLFLGPLLTYLSPFTYAVREDGSISELNDRGVIEAAWQQRVAPLMVLANFAEGEFRSDLIAAVLRNPSAREALIDNTLAKMRERGYAGVSLDFEFVYPEDRENYNGFLRRLVERLRPEGYLVATALAPKTSAGQSGLLYEAHDYETHGQWADFVIIMTYEWGWVGGPPWAIAPINEVRRVLDYAVTAIPRNKVMMSMPLYGRDWNVPWTEGSLAETISPQDALELARRYGARIEYDETYQSPFFRYTDETGQGHEVWFEDARSVQSKFNLLREYGLRGVSYWVLGSPFPQNWLVLGRNFSVRKW